MHHVYSPKFYITTVAGYDVVSREIADKIGGGVGGGGRFGGGEVSKAYFGLCENGSCIYPLIMFQYQFLSF